MQDNGVRRKVWREGIDERERERERDRGRARGVTRERVRRGETVCSILCAQQMGERKNW